MTGRHYARVIDFDLEKNKVSARGPIRPSSESLTHAALYQVDPKINAVIHVHNLDMWKKLMEKVPTSSAEATYGTPEMAKEMMRLYKDTDLRDRKILVMGGHEEGIISFGRNLDEAGKILLSHMG